MLFTLKCSLWNGENLTLHALSSYDCIFLIFVSVSHPKNSYSTRSRCSSVTSVSLSSLCDAPAAAVAVAASTCVSAPSLTSAHKKISAPGETPAGRADSSGQSYQPHRQVSWLPHWVRQEESHQIISLFFLFFVVVLIYRLSWFKCWQFSTLPFSLYSLQPVSSRESFLYVCSKPPANLDFLVAKTADFLMLAVILAVVGSIAW